MELNWLQCLVYGLVAGFTEFVPVSADSHMRLLGHMMGLDAQQTAYSAAVRIAALAALVLACWPQISRLRREQHIASIPAKRRKRQPDMNSIKDWKLMKTALFPLVLALICDIFLPELFLSLPMVILFCVVNGVLLYLPAYYPTGNKSSATVSGLDGFMIGLGGALSCFCGISRIAAMTGVGMLRGCDRQYIMNIALLLSVPALAVLAVLDIAALIAFGAGFTVWTFLGCLLTAAAAFGGAYGGIITLRFLSVKAGFSSLAYYCWGFALFTLILFLMI